MKTGKRAAIALTKSACPLCGNLEDDQILIKQRIVTEKTAKEFEDKFNGKAIGYLKEPCKECKEIMEKAFLLIGFVKAKTDDMKNPYRSGNKWGISKEAALKAFGEDRVKAGVAFIDILVAKEIGLPEINLDA